MYKQTRQKNPARLSGQTRNWSPVAAVTIPESAVTLDRNTQRWLAHIFLQKAA